MDRYSLTPYAAFLSALENQRHYSIEGLRNLAHCSGFDEAELVQFTEKLIWNRHFHDFPREGDGIELIDFKAIVAWTGARWKQLLPKPVQTPKPLIKRLFDWAA